MRDLIKNKKYLDIYFAIGIIIFCIAPIIFQIHQEQKIIIRNSPTYDVASICYPYNQTTNIPETLKTSNPNIETGIVYALSSSRISLIVATTLSAFLIFVVPQLIYIFYKKYRTYNKLITKVALRFTNTPEKNDELNMILKTHKDILKKIDKIKNKEREKNGEG